MTFDKGLREGAARITFGQISMFVDSKLIVLDFSPGLIIIADLFIRVQMAEYSRPKAVDNHRTLTFATLPSSPARKRMFLPSTALAA